MRSKAGTVAEYLAQLSEERRAAIAAVRDVILAHLPPGYQEAMNWGMIAYEVPLATYPDTYNGQPLMYAALASQKRYMSIYLMGVYADEQSRLAFEAAYRATGKRMDVGKACLRFRSLDDLPLTLIGESIASLDVAAFVSLVKVAQSSRRPKS